MGGVWVGLWRGAGGARTRGVAGDTVHKGRRRGGGGGGVGVGGCRGGVGKASGVRRSTWQGAIQRAGAGTHVGGEGGPGWGGRAGETVGSGAGEGGWRGRGGGGRGVRWSAGEHAAARDLGRPCTAKTPPKPRGTGRGERGGGGRGRAAGASDHTGPGSIYVCVSGVWGGLFFVLFGTFYCGVGPYTFSV